MARRKPAKMTAARLLAISLTLALLAAAVYCVGVYIDILRVRWQLPALIPKAAAAHGLDPLLVQAVVIEESGMNYRAQSRKGAIGLMQVRPVVLEDYARGTGRSFTSNQLRDPEINLEVGCWYLARMVKAFRGQRDPVYFALAAYNAGATNVERWIGDAKGLSGEEFLQRIGFKGTRAYVARIVNRWSRLAQSGARSSSASSRRIAQAPSPAGEVFYVLGGFPLFYGD